MSEPDARPSAEELARQYNRLKTINHAAQGRRNREDAGIDRFLGICAILVGLGLAAPIVLSLMNWESSPVTLSVQGMILFAVGSISCLGWGFPRLTS